MAGSAATSSLASHAGQRKPFVLGASCRGPLRPPGALGDQLVEAGTRHPVLVRRHLNAPNGQLSLVDHLIEPAPCVPAQLGGRGNREVLALCHYVAPLSCYLDRL